MSELVRQRGYLTIAQDTGSLSYLRMAYGLALSLRATQKDTHHLSVMVTPGTKIPEEYAWAFDKVVEIPGNDDAHNFDWKIQNKWKVYMSSPYEETVLLDSDMVVTNDISDWWDTLNARDLWFATCPVTYRGDVINRSRFRDAFVYNDLPMVYTAFAYFRKRPFADEFFQMLKKVFRNWYRIKDYYHNRPTPEDELDALVRTRSKDRWSWTHFLQYPLPNLSGDLAYALTVKIMGLEELCSPEGGFPTFTHMKMGSQGIPNLEDTNWTNHIPWTLKDNLTLLVGNHVQRYPFHYVEKDWLSDGVMKKLEDAARG